MVERFTKENEKRKEFINKQVTLFIYYSLKKKRQYMLYVITKSVLSVEFIQCQTRCKKIQTLSEVKIGHQLLLTI